MIEDALEATIRVRLKVVSGHIESIHLLDVGQFVALLLITSYAAPLDE